MEQHLKIGNRIQVFRYNRWETITIDSYAELKKIRNLYESNPEKVKKFNENS